MRCCIVRVEVRPSITDTNALALHTGNGLLCGLMWWQLGYDEADIFPRMTACFAIPLAWVFFPLLEVRRRTPRRWLASRWSSLFARRAATHAACRMPL